MTRSNAQMDIGPPIYCSIMPNQEDSLLAEYWKKRWEKNDISWQRHEVHKFLVKYIDKLTDGRAKTRVFVPLCGKSLDMLWLADQGHDVVGVEISLLAIHSFFEENGLTFLKKQVKLAALIDPVDVYECVQKQITIFCCDVFSLSEEDTGGRFDAIWDRASLSAIQPAFGDRGKRYTKKMRSLLADDGNCLLESHFYEVERNNEPPASLSMEFRNQLYEEDFVLKELEVEKSDEDFERKWGYSQELHYHLIKPKAK